MLDDSESVDLNSRTERFASFLAESQERLFGYVHSLVRDFNDADDLFQQTTIVLWKKFDDFDQTRSFAAWAMGIARFEVANFLRTRSRSRLYFSDELNLMLIDAQEQLPSQEVENRRAALQKCMQTLRERDRQLLEQCYSVETTIVDLASRMGRSSHSVYNSLRRIRRSLFECIRQTLLDGAIPDVGTAS